MEQGRSRTGGGDPVKGNAVAPAAEDYLTDGVVRGCMCTAAGLCRTLTLAFCPFVFPAVCLSQCASGMSRKMRYVNAFQAYATVHRSQTAVMQMSTARAYCFDVLAKKTMYPDLNMATAAAHAVFRDELPGMTVPTSVVTKLATKVRRCLRVLLLVSFSCGMCQNLCSASVCVYSMHDCDARHHAHRLPMNITRKDAAPHTVPS